MGKTGGGECSGRQEDREEGEPPSCVGKAGKAGGTGRWASGVGAVHGVLKGLALLSGRCDLVCEEDFERRCELA